MPVYDQNYTFYPITQSIPEVFSTDQQNRAHFPELLEMGGEVVEMLVYDQNCTFCPINQSILDGFSPDFDNRAHPVSFLT